MSKTTTGVGTALAALLTVLSSQVHAGVISPSGSLDIQLESGGIVASNSPNNQLLASSMLTVTGTRYVFETSPVNGTYNLGISVNDTESVISVPSYSDGTYGATSLTTPLAFTIDGLEFSFNSISGNYQTVGQSAFQNLELTGVMDAGTNSVTEQQYTSAPASLTFTLSQANGSGVISYGVTLTVPDDVPEPASLPLLGVGLLGLGLVHRCRTALNRVSAQREGRSS